MTIVEIVARAMYAVAPRKETVVFGDEGMTVRSIPYETGKPYRFEEMVSRGLKALDEAGFAVVPKDPSDEMLDAGAAVWGNDRSGDVWEAMIAAAKEK